MTETVESETTDKWQLLRLEIHRPIPPLLPSVALVPASQDPSRADV